MKYPRASGVTFWGRSVNALRDTAEWCEREMHRSITFERSNEVMEIAGQRYRLDMTLDGLDHAHELALADHGTPPALRRGHGPNRDS